MECGKRYDQNRGSSVGQSAQRLVAGRAVSNCAIAPCYAMTMQAGLVLDKGLWPT
jgi:hypothetical protein